MRSPERRQEENETEKTLFSPPRAADAVREKSTLHTCELTQNGLQRAKTEGRLKIYLAFKDFAGVPLVSPAVRDKTYLG